MPKNQIEEWSVTISDLSDEQREILKTMISENLAGIQAQLKEWGIETPEAQYPSPSSMFPHQCSIGGFSVEDASETGLFRL